MKKWKLPLICLGVLLLAAAGFWIWHSHSASSGISDAALAKLYSENEQNGGEAAGLSALPEDFFGSDFDGEPYEPKDSGSSVATNILGYDDRTTINDTASYPYSAVAYMISKFTCGCEITGTAFLVSRNTLLSAAHLVVCEEHGGTMCQATFYFGYHTNGSYAYVYRGPTTYWYGTSFPDGYTNSAEQDDYAYIRLESDNVGDKMGWLGIWCADDSLYNMTCYLTGYRRGVLKMGKGKCSYASDKEVSVSMDTQPGNSGGPVCVGIQAGYYAVAIVVSESKDGTANYARRITEDLFAEMTANGVLP